MNNGQGSDAADVNWSDIKQAFEYMSSQFGGHLPEVPGLLVSKFGGAMGLGTALNPKADPYDRVSGAIGFFESAVGGLASELHMLSGGIGEMGAAAGSLAGAAGFLTIGSMTALQFGLMGLPYAKAAAERKADGEKNGYLLGFAAGATYGDASFVRNYLDVYRHFVDGEVVEEAYEEAFRKSLWAGFHAAENISPTEKNAFIGHIIDAAVQHGDKWSGFHDDYESMVHGIANTVAHDISLLRPDAATGHAGLNRPEAGASF